MSNVYWNSPYQENDHYDEFGFAKGVRSNETTVATISIADHLSGRNKVILIRKDYSDEFSRVLPDDVKRVAKCIVTTRDPLLTVKGMENAVVFDFHVKISLPPVFSSVNMPLDINIPPAIVPGPIYGPLERGCSIIYAVSRYIMTTESMFTGLRVEMYAKVMHKIRAMIDNIKLEQRS